MFKKIADRIWTTSSNQTAFGLDIGTRTTAIDLDGKGSLFVHSPRVDAADHLKKLGTVNFAVLPNKWRRGNAVEFKVLFPDAVFFCAPELEKIEKNLPLTSITEGARFPWSDQIDHLLIRGSPFFNEVAFYHKLSRTLILADHGGYMYDGGPLTAQLGLKLLKSQKIPGWSEQEKKLYVRDRKLYGDSISKIFEWDFIRAIVAHGPVISTVEKTTIRSALSGPSPSASTDHQ
jgi:hypothetical protein